MFKRQIVPLILLTLLCFSVAAKDLYKILGVDKNADQRQIKKAFHKLSLKYHPDKNKAKDAQDKFAEIGNAYEILGNEEKRKQYDLRGDEPQGGPYERSYQDGRNFQGGQGGWSGFDSGPSGQRQYTYYSTGSGDHGFSQEGPTGFHFDFNDFMNFGGFDFSNMFGGAAGFNPKPNQPSSSAALQQLSPTDFKTKVLDSSETWLILFASSTAPPRSEAVEEFARHMNGIIKVGYISCQLHKQLCKDLHVSVSKDPKLHIYPWMPSRKRTAVEYTGDWKSKAIEAFSVEFLPRLSTRVTSDDYRAIYRGHDGLPRALLLTKKKDTPAMWRAVSAVFHGRVALFDSQVNDAADSLARMFKVRNLPAVVGILANDEAVVLPEGSSLKYDDLKRFLADLEAKNKAAPKQSPKAEDVYKLTKDSFSRFCSQSSLCVIAVSRTKAGERKASTVLREVSKLKLQPATRASSESLVSYSLLDGEKQKGFLKAFGDKRLQTEDPVVVAYKPRKGRFATHTGTFSSASIEAFVMAALNGEVKFEKVKKEPSLS